MTSVVVDGRLQRRVDFKLKLIDHKKTNRRYKLSIWDTAGQERCVVLCFCDWPDLVIALLWRSLADWLHVAVALLASLASYSAW